MTTQIERKYKERHNSWNRSVDNGELKSKYIKAKRHTGYSRSFMQTWTVWYYSLELLV
jgi:hypothetical protein